MMTSHPALHTVLERPTLSCSHAGPSASSIFIPLELAGAHSFCRMSVLMPSPWQASPQYSPGTPTALVTHELPGNRLCPWPPHPQHPANPVTSYLLVTPQIEGVHGLWAATMSGPGSGATVRSLLFPPHYYAPSETGTHGAYGAPAGLLDPCLTAARQREASVPLKGEPPVPRGVGLAWRPTQAPQLPRFTGSRPTRLTPVHVPPCTKSGAGSDSSLHSPRHLAQSW